MYTFSKAISNVSGTATREILKRTEGGDILSFAGGLPARECLPTDELKAILDKLFASGEAGRLMQYGISEGDIRLRQSFCTMLQQEGIAATPEAVAVVSGGQQGLELSVKAFVDPGDTVLVEDPTYLAFLQIARLHRAEVKGVAATDEGLDLTDLENKLKAHKPKLLYVVPTFSNPTGKTYTEKNRRGILQLCQKYGTILLEDDPYAKLRFTGTPVPTIKSMDKDGIVIYVTSLSKVFAPGLRVAAVCAPPEIIGRITLGKQNSDLHTSLLSQAAAREFMDGGGLPRNIARGIPIYRARAEALQNAIDRYFPKGRFTRTTPEGGLFVWVALDPVFDTAALFPAAIERKVAYVSGNVFYADGSHKNTLRLNYSNLTEPDIDRGMQILGGLLNESI